MSRKHPQNGPSLSKAPNKKQKPLTDEELARIQAKEREREDRLRTEAQKSQRWSKAMRATGGMIPVRGAGAEKFWAGLKDDPQQSERFFEAAKQVGASEKEEDADKAFKKAASAKPKAAR